MKSGMSQSSFMFSTIEIAISIVTWELGLVNLMLKRCVRKGIHGLQGLLGQPILVKQSRKLGSNVLTPLIVDDNSALRGLCVDSHKPIV